MTQYIYGMHDPGGEHLFADRKGWIVFTEAIGSDPNDKTGRDYSQWSNAGYGVLVRLNNGYGSAGTIPTPDKHIDFARRVGNFAVASQGCSRWIVGNEPNHSQEWPNGQMITSAMYSDCFNRCAAELYDRIETPHEALLAGIAPWNAQAGDWLVYFADMLARTIGFADGFALHTYTHGDSPQLITSKDIMDDEPFRGRWYQFYAYRDFMTTVPEKQRGMSVYITETDQDKPWTDANTGWVQEAYAEIDRWNKTDGTQKIYCLALYRWPKHDQWSIVDKPGVHADLRAAVGQSYQSPAIGSIEQVTNQTHLPTISNPAPSPAQPALPPRQIDPRATQRGVTIVQPRGVPLTWAVTKVQWYDEQEADRLGPDHHIMADVLDEQGKRLASVPLMVRWPDGEHRIVTEAKPGEPYSTNFPMSPSRNEFSITVDGLALSEVVTGIGMGMETPGGWNSSIHTSTGVVFQRVGVATQPTSPPQPSATYTMWVNVPAGANVRDRPIDGNILTAIPFAQQVTVLGTDSASGWKRVVAGGKEGFMAPMLLSAKEPEQPQEPTPQPGGVGSGIIDPLTALAFLQVESGNRAFTDGLLTIRFEVHRFQANLKNDALFDRHFKFTPRNYAEQYWRPTPESPWIHAHGSMADRHKLLNFAMSLNQNAALRSTGMGTAQIMGENHRRIGYSNPSAMFMAFSHPKYGVNAQVLGFVNYVLSDPDLFAALRERDWMTAVQAYNGTGQESIYIPALENALKQINQEVGA